MAEKPLTPFEILCFEALIEANRSQGRDHLQKKLEWSCSNEMHFNLSSTSIYSYLLKTEPVRFGKTQLTRVKELLDSGSCALSPLVKTTYPNDIDAILQSLYTLQPENLSEAAQIVAEIVTFFSNIETEQQLSLWFPRSRNNSNSSSASTAAPLENIALPSISDSEIKNIDKFIRDNLSLPRDELTKNLDDNCQNELFGTNSVDLLRAYLHHQNSAFGFYWLTKDKLMDLRYELFKKFVAPIHLEEIKFLHSRSLATDLGIKTQRHDSLFSWCCVRIAGHLHRLVHCSLLQQFPEDNTVQFFNGLRCSVDNVGKTLKDSASKINRYNAWMITATTLFTISLRNFFSHGTSKVEENRAFINLKDLLKSPETNSDIEESRKGFKHFFETIFRCAVDDDKNVRIDMSMTTPLDLHATTALCDLALSCAKFIVDSSTMKIIPCPPIPLFPVSKDSGELVAVNAPKVALDPKTRNKIVFPLTKFQVSRANDLISSSASPKASESSSTSVELCREKPFILSREDCKCPSLHVQCVALSTPSDDDSDDVVRLVPCSFFSSTHASVKWSAHASIDPSTSTVKYHIKKQPPQTGDVAFSMPEDQFLLLPRFEKSIKVSFPSSFESNHRVKLPHQQPLFVSRSDRKFTMKKTPDDPASAKKESDSTVQLCDKHPIVFKAFPEDDNDSMIAHLEGNCDSPHLWCIAVVNDSGDEIRLVPLSYLQDRNDFARPAIDGSLRSEKRIRELCQPFFRSNRCSFGTRCFHAHLTKQEFFDCPILVDRLRNSNEKSNLLLLNVLRSSMSTRIFDFVPSFSNGHIFGDMKTFWVIIADGLNNNNNNNKNATKSDDFARLEYALGALEMGPHAIMEDFMRRFIALIEHVAASDDRPMIRSRESDSKLELVRDSSLLTPALRFKTNSAALVEDCEICSRSHETHFHSLLEKAAYALQLFLLEMIYELFQKWMKSDILGKSECCYDIFSGITANQKPQSFETKLKSALRQLSVSRSTRNDKRKLVPDPSTEQFVKDLFPWLESKLKVEELSEWSPFCERIFPPDELENFFTSAFNTLKDAGKKAPYFNLDNLIKVKVERIAESDYLLTSLNIEAAFGDNYKTLVDQKVIPNSGLTFDKDQFHQRLIRQLRKEECVSRTWVCRKPNNKDNPFRHHRWLLFNGDVAEIYWRSLTTDRDSKLISLIFKDDSLDQSFFTSKTKFIPSVDNSPVEKKSSYSLKTSTHDVEFANAAFLLMLRRRNHWLHVTSDANEQKEPNVKDFAVKSIFEEWGENNSSASPDEKAREMIKLAGTSLRWSVKFYKRVFLLLHLDIAHQLQREPNPSIRARLFRRLLTPVKMMKTGDENKPDECVYRSSPFVVSDQIQRPCFILVRDKTIRDDIRNNKKLNDRLKDFIVMDEKSLLSYLEANMTEENRSTCDNDCTPSGTAISHRRALVVVLQKQEVKDDYLMELAGDTLMLMYVCVDDKNTSSIKNSSAKNATIPKELMEFEEEVCIIKSLVFWTRRYQEANGNTAPSMADLERQSWYNNEKFSQTRKVLDKLKSLKTVLDAFSPNKEKSDVSVDDIQIEWMLLNGSYFRKRCFAESKERFSDKSLWFHREIFDRIFYEKSTENQLPALLENEILPFLNEIGTTNRVDDLIKKYSTVERHWLDDRLLPACPKSILHGSTLMSREEALIQMKTDLRLHVKNNNNNNNSNNSYDKLWWDKFIEVPLKALFYRRIAQCGAAFDFEDFKSSMIELIKKTTTVKEEGKDAVHVALHDLLPGLWFLNVEIGHRDFHLCSSEVVCDNGSPQCLKYGETCTFVHDMSKEFKTKDLERKMKESRDKLGSLWTNRSKEFETHVQIGHLLIPRNLLQQGCIDPLSSVAHWCWNTTCSGANHNCRKAHVNGTAAHSSLEERKKAISLLRKSPFLPREQYVSVSVDELVKSSSSQFSYPFHALDFKFRREVLENVDGTKSFLKISENDAKFLIRNMKR